MFQVNWPFGSGEEAQNRFQQSGNGCHLGFPTGMIFDIKVNLMLPTKFQVNWPFSSGEEAINRFSRWRPSGISNWNNFSCFFFFFLFFFFFGLTVTLMLPTKFQVNWPWGVG